MAIFSYSTIAELLVLYLSTKILGLFFDPTSYFLIGLNYYLPPDLEQVDGIKAPKQHQRKPNAKKRRKQAEQEKEYLTSKRLDSFVLFQDKITVENFPEYSKNFLVIEDLQWIFVLTIQTLLVYVVSNTIKCLDTTPVNLDLSTILLCFMAFVGVSLNFKYLSKRSVKHFDTQMAFFIGILCSIFAFGALHLPPSIIDFRLEMAMPELNNNIKKIYVSLATPEDKIVDELIEPLYIRLTLAIICGLISSSYVLPALRISKYYNEMVNADENGIIFNAAIHFTYFAPLFLCLCWIPPLTADFILTDGLVQCNENDLIRDCNSFPPVGYFFITESTFYAGRTYVLLFSSFLSAYLLRNYLQAHLEEAKNQVNEIMHTVSNIDQAMTNRISYGVKQIFWRVCVVGVQYCGPIMFNVALALLLHRKGNYDLGICKNVRNGLRTYAGWQNVGTNNALFNSTDARSRNKTDFINLLIGENDEAKQITNFVKEITFTEIFTPNMYRPILGFAIFWSLFSWFSLSALGLMYYRRQQLFAQVVPQNMNLSTIEKSNDKNEKAGGPVKHNNEWGKAKKKYQAQ
eukprot:g4662.t1